MHASVLTTCFSPTREFACVHRTLAMSGYDGSAVDLFDFHHSMLADEGRTAAFRDAILSTVTSRNV